MKHLLNQPYCIDPSASAEFSMQVRALREYHVQSIMEISAEAMAAMRIEPKIAGGVARIPVDGVCLRSCPEYYSYFGFTSYEAIAGAIDAAEADKDVSEIQLMVNSPGGAVDGIDTMVKRIRSSSKPTTAYGKSLVASAAYWISSATSEGIYMSDPNDLVGSIGTIMLLVDSSEFYASMGFQVIPIYEGKWKAQGYPGVKLEEGYLEEMQALVTSLNNDFKASVAEGRGYSKKEIDQVATGSVFRATMAQDLGLVDGLGTPRASSKINSQLKYGDYYA